MAPGTTKRNTDRSATSARKLRSRPLDAKTGNRGDWRAGALSRIRALIRRADPEVIEEVKWRKPSNPAGVPVWSHDGILCTGETYKDKVKITFANGAALEDPAGLFNAGLEGNVRRAIDLRKGDEIASAAFQSLIRDAVAYNARKRGAKRAPAKKPAKSAKKATGNQHSARPRLLSGGNPQVAKGDGDAPVQAYIAAMPGVPVFHPLVHQNRRHRRPRSPG